MGQSPMHKVSKVRRAHSMSSAVLTSKLNGCHVGLSWWSVVRVIVKLAR